ncbi:MAG: cyclase family protein [Chthoniobacterales bacterium]|nr:cyclase family protein [Chthoniobacterales bacterium]
MSSPFPYTSFDLTHTLEETIPSWNGSCGFHQVTKLDYTPKENEISFRVQQLKMHAGIGTHLDAPAHCNLGTLSIEQLSLNHLIAPCVMIDLSVAAHERYTASVEEVQTFEKAHGMIDPGSFVIIRTGWERFWKEPERYHNNYLFPAVSAEVASLLLERNVVGLGIDTLSPDRPGEGFPVHATLLGANKYIVENIANSALLPPKGSITFALPIKTHRGTEAPMRLVALIKK